jgi:hypothetical protein
VRSLVRAAAVSPTKSAASHKTISSRWKQAGRAATRPDAAPSFSASIEIRETRNEERARSKTHISIAQRGPIRLPLEPRFVLTDAFCVAGAEGEHASLDGSGLPAAETRVPGKIGRSPAPSWRASSGSILLGLDMGSARAICHHVRYMTRRGPDAPIFFPH